MIQQPGQGLTGQRRPGDHLYVPLVSGGERGARSSSPASGTSAVSISNPGKQRRQQQQADAAAYAQEDRGCAVCRSTRSAAARQLLKTAAASNPTVKLLKASMAARRRFKLIHGPTSASPRAKAKALSTFMHIQAEHSGGPARPAAAHHQHLRQACKAAASPSSTHSGTFVNSINVNTPLTLNIYFDHILSLAFAWLYVD